MPDTNSASIHLTGGEELTAKDAQRVTKSYTPGPQESVEETPDEVDNSPLTDEERDGILKATDDEFHSPLDQGSEVRDRAPMFEVPEQRVPAYVKARRQREMMLPNIASVHDLEKRVGTVAAHDGAPEDILNAVRQAREAIEAVRTAYRDGGHPSNPRFAVNQAAKDEVTVRLADAVKAVKALESVAQRPDLQDEHFQSLTSTIEEKRQAALDALRDAERLYASFRGAVGSAEALAIQQGRWDESYHRSVVSATNLSKVLPVLKETIGYVDPESETSDDLTLGRHVSTDYGDEIPPHTLEELRKVGELSGSGSFPHQIFLRAASPSKEDHALAEALATKKFRIFMNSNPFAPKRDDIAGGIG